MRSALVLLALIGRVQSYAAPGFTLYAHGVVEPPRGRGWLRAANDDDAQMQRSLDMLFAKRSGIRELTSDLELRDMAKTAALPRPGLRNGRAIGVLYLDDDDDSDDGASSAQPVRLLSAMAAAYGEAGLWLLCRGGGADVRAARGVDARGAHLELIVGDRRVCDVLAVGSSAADVAAVGERVTEALGALGFSYGDAAAAAAPGVARPDESFVLDPTASARYGSTTTSAFEPSVRAATPNERDAPSTPKITSSYFPMGLEMEKPTEEAKQREAEKLAALRPKPPPPPARPAVPPSAYTPPAGGPLGMLGKIAPQQKKGAWYAKKPAREKKETGRFTKPNPQKVDFLQRAMMLSDDDEGQSSSQANPPDTMP